MSSLQNAGAVATPVAQSERLVILDSLRGFAILGILLMNVTGFGLAEILTFDPTVLNETGINYQTWYFIDWIMEGTQRALFSMLFGAGMILFISRQENKIPGVMPAEIFFRRQLWLLLFGLFNGFILLWYWDILFQYAIAGMILFTFRRLSPKKLLIAAAVCLVINTTFDNLELYKRKLTILKGEYAASIDTTKRKLTTTEKENIAAMEGLKERSTRASKLKAVEKENKTVLGSFSVLWDARTDKTVEVEMELIYHDIWDPLLFMLIGMAFFKNGWLLGKAPAWVYGLLFVVGWGVGLYISYLRQQAIIDSGFNSFQFAKDNAFTFYQLSRLFRAFGFFGMIMLLYKSGLFKWLFALVRPAGQMAFTNYLMQSLISAIYFYGIGFGNFSKLQRIELYYYVGIVWIFQIIFSHIWLRYFRFGPFEWLWRTLTYWKKQPFLKSKKEEQEITLSIA